MKKRLTGFALVFSLLLLMMMSFSFVEGALPTIVRNTATITKPYETGGADFEAIPQRYADAQASYDVSNGIVKAIAYASVTSNSWASSYLQDGFEIIHSSNYEIIFSFDYSGIVRITGLDFLGMANAKVSLEVYLTDRNGGEINRIVTIAYEAENVEKILSDQIQVVLTASLEEGHIYDWKAKLLTAASANTGAFFPEVTADFYSEGYGVEIVQVVVKDLNPDNIPPTTNCTLVGIKGENGEWYNSSVSVTLSAVDDPPNGYGLNYTNVKINSGPWSPYTRPFIITSEGASTIYFYSVDKANNQEDPNTVIIKIDKTAPTGQIMINNNAAYTNSEIVQLSVVAQDGQGSGVSQIRFRNEGTNSNWNPWITYTTSLITWTLTNGDGSNRVYAQFIDKAGNISPETSIYDDIILDTSPPSASILINQGDQYTNSTSVVLYLQYSDDQDIVSARYSNDNVYYTGWESIPASKTKNLTLSSGDGTKTVYAQFRDRTGLPSNPVSDTIVLDTIPPTGSIEVNGGASSTTSNSVTITPNAVDSNGVSEIRLRNDGEDWSAWGEFEPKTWSLTSGLGAKTVFAEFKDDSGLVSQSCNATISLVEPPPTPSGKGRVTIYVRDESGNSIDGATVTSSVKPAGQSSLSGITDSRGLLFFNDILAGSYSFQASKTDFNSNNAQVTVKSDETSAVTIKLQETTTPPEDLTEPNVTLTIRPENSGAAERFFTITANDNENGSGLSNVTLYIDEKAVATWTTGGTHDYSEGFFSIGAHTYYVEAFDNAGNVARNPTSGSFEFAVEPESTELWKIAGVGLVLAMGAALMFFASKSKR